MNYPEKELIVVPECNDENDNPTCWAIASDYDRTSDRVHYIWICKYADNEYVIENSDGRNLTEKIFKTLRGAKIRAEGIIYRQFSTGSFTD